MARRQIVLFWTPGSGVVASTRTGTQAPGLWIKREEGVEAVVKVLDEDGNLVLLEDSLKPVLTGKPQNARDFDPLWLLSGDDWTVDTEEKTYTAVLHASAEAIDEFLKKNGDPDDDVILGNAVLELYYTPTDDQGNVTSGDVLVELRNNAGRSDDGTPTAVADPVTWLLRNGMLNPGYWTALTGGGATSLDGVVTVGVIATGHVITTAIMGDVAEWQLQAGTDAENAAAGVVRPDDYHASTNARVWKRVR
jgi:hypothetical protein